MDDYPENLFTLLAPTYEFKAWEPLTDLCPESICERRVDPLWQRVIPVLSDVGVVYLHILLPTALAFGLPPVTQNWKNFVGSQTFEDRWFKAREDDRRGPVTELIDAIEPNALRPTFYFLHLLIPHEPWLYLPSGQAFTIDGRIVALESNGNWNDDAWAVAQNYQRHLLQVGYADTVLGAILTKFREVGLYDEALIVVTADHGASFQPGQSFRQPTQATVADIMSIPLFVKRPGQEAGSVSDRNVETIDIFPTLADELGIQLPGKVDGASALALERPERSQKIIFFDDAHISIVIDDPLSDLLSAAAFHKAHIFGVPADRYQLTGLSVHKELMGKRLDRLPVREPDREDVVVTLDVPEAFSNVNLDGEFLPAHVTGTVYAEAVTAESQLLAIAVNGTVRATTSVYDFPVTGRTGAWEVMVDPESLQPGNNSIDVLFIRQDTTGKVWLEPAYNPPPRCFTEFDSGGSRGLVWR